MLARLIQFSITHAALVLLLAGVLLGVVALQTVSAHVPYIEGKDYSDQTDFEVRKIIQSKAFYAYLDAEDTDEFVMDVDTPVRIYIHMLIPFCKEYANYTTSWALTGPGLPGNERTGSLQQEVQDDRSTGLAIAVAVRELAGHETAIALLLHPEHTPRAVA